MHDRSSKAASFLRHLQPLQGRLEAYCRRSLHDLNDVPDVLQSAVAAAFRDFHLYAEGTSFRAWIFRYLDLEIQNFNRKYTRAQHKDLPTDLTVEDIWQLNLHEPLFEVLLEDPDAVLEQCDSTLADSLRELSAKDRSILLLHAIGEFKYREIAEILGVPVGTVMSSLARCRLLLRLALVEYGQQIGFLKSEEK